MHQAVTSTVPEPQAAPNQAAAIHALMPLPDLLTNRQSPESWKIQIIHLLPPRHKNNKLVVLLNLVSLTQCSLATPLQEQPLQQCYESANQAAPRSAHGQVQRTRSPNTFELRSAFLIKRPGAAP